MPLYRYRAVAASGEYQNGDAEAPNAEAAKQSLRRRGLMIVELREAGEATPGGLLSSVTKPRIGARAIADFASGLATLIDAGLPLDRALAASGRDGAQAPLRRIAAELREAVRRGRPLAQAMERYPKAFTPMHRALIQAGETGGNLAECLRRMAEMAERAAAMREAMRSALVYPACLIGLAILSLIFIATAVLPQFKPFFDEAGAAMPLPAEILLGFGDLLRDYCMLLLPLLVASLWGLRRLLSRPELRQRRDHALLNLAILGPLLAALEAERLCRLLGVLLRQGVPLPAAWLLTMEGLGNAAFAASLGHVGAAIRRGGDLAASIGQSPYLPTTAVDLVAIGEQSGRLADMLLRAADLIDQESKRRTQRLLALLSPAITVIVGAMVAAVIATVFTALLGLNQLAA